MPRSIRFTLLAWFAALLAAVLAGFGTAFYQRLQQLTEQRVQTELLAAAERIAGRLDHAAAAFPEALLQRFGAAENEAAYAVVWRADGTRRASAAAPPDVPPPPRLHRGPPAVTARFRHRGEREEVAVPWRGGELLVGRSTAAEEEHLQRLAWELAAIGAAVLAVGLGGGRLLIERALRPLAAMSATAQDVSASNLSQRLEEARLPGELRPLAGILNRMLGRIEDAFAQEKSFTADASHELRTPLAVIASQTELALARPRSPAEYQEALETCAKAAARMRSLVDGLLTLARADAGELQLAVSASDLAASVAEQARLLAPLAREHGVEIALDLQPVAWEGDRQRIGQAVTNLLTNAIRYNRPGGRVEVRLRGEGREVILTVSDTGIGIPAAELEAVFQRFHRVDAARSREAGGSGLGLAICRSLVEAHGGTVACTSEVGRGSTFTVTLPAATVFT